MVLSYTGENQDKQRGHLMKRITPEERVKLIELLKEKRSIKEVVEISGRSKRSLIKIAKENDIKMKFGSLRPDEEESIIVLLKENKSSRQIAKIVGRGSTTVLRVAANHKILLKPRLRRKASDKNQ